MRLGEWDLSEEIDCQNQICSDKVQDIPVKDIILHEDYNVNSIGHEHDIALILLEKVLSKFSIEIPHYFDNFK